MNGNNSYLSRSFSLLWRISILILPWQTRWIFTEGSLNEFPWEQGSVSLYGSQVVLILTILVGAMVFRGEWKSLFRRVAGGQWRVGGKDKSLIVSAVALFVIVSTATVSWVASGMWWMNVILIVGFLMTLHVARIPVHLIAKWFVISIIPHAALAVYQYFQQDILGFTILGIAEHRPWIQGTSVVEHGLYRVLRSYGGFPHPNILGGWLAMGLILLPTLVIRAKAKIGMFSYVFASALFAIAFVFTFSRGAWIAGVLGFLLALFFAWKKSSESLQKQAVALLGVITIFMIGLGVFTQYDHVKARFTTEHRLEAWSLMTRSKAISDGIEAWRLRPVAGWGVGASLVGISEIRGSDELWSSIAPEPPHVVPLVILTETGILGALAFVALIIAIIRLLFIKKRWDTIPILIAGSAIALTDHYLFTLWPGIVLMAFMLFFVLFRSYEE
jgi:O-antigen ligase